MGIGGGIFLIALGAIITFAIHVDVSWIDLRVVGWVMMMAGATILAFTVWFWQDRRRRRRMTLSEQAQASQTGGAIHPDTPENGTDYPRI
jgi:uncharacterized membrane protein YbhN (UPF0104 family)